MTLSYSVNYLRIDWEVKNVFSLSRQDTEQFRFRTSLWVLTFEKVTVEENTERFEVHLKETRSREHAGDFVRRVFIVDKDRTPQFSSEQDCKITDSYYKDCVWSIDVEDLRRKEGILWTDDAMQFICILISKSTSGDENTENKALDLETSISVKGGDSSVETLVLDFRRLLEDNALSDVTLKCGDRTIPAHRAILSARSEVFAAMFRNDMAESRSGVIEVSDMEPPVLEQLLQFIYSCKLPDMSMDTTPQLYEAADKYGVESLKKDCSAFMKENLTEENVCSILLVADAHSDSDLKDCAVSFVVEAKLFKKDDIWVKFCKDHPILAVEVLNRVCKKFS